MARRLSHWERCMVSTCKHQPSDRVSPHPHKYQHTQWQLSWRQETKLSYWKCPSWFTLSILPNMAISPGCVLPIIIMTQHMKNTRFLQLLFFMFWICTELHAVWGAVFRPLTQVHLLTQTIILKHNSLLILGANVIVPVGQMICKWLWQTRRDPGDVDMLDGWGILGFNTAGKDKILFPY